ncbi:MAG: helical backbone metal receptor [Syntrophales bacterium]|nr:helical backbone metal receptor [Syntrophales bacterium]
MPIFGSMKLDILSHSLRIFLPVLILVAFSFLTTAAAEVYIDKAGRRVNIPSPPRRIVSLAPSITETLFALGLDREIVGVTMMSNYPEAAKSKPRVGNFINISLERVVSLNPDLVIGTADGNRKETVKQLEGMGLPVYVVNPGNLSEIFHMILSIGTITGRENEATTLVDGLQKRVERIISSLNGLKKPQVFFQIGINPVITAGMNTLHNELIQRADGVNI